MAKIYLNINIHEQIEKAYKYKIIDIPNNLEIPVTTFTNPINLRVMYMKSTISSYLYITEKIIENTLMILLTILLIKYTILYNQFITLGYMIFISLFTLTLILTLKDYIRKNKIQKDKKYIIISIIYLSIIIFTLIRTLYDKSFIYNSKQYVEEYLKSNPTEIDILKQYNALYFLQNIPYFIGLLLLSLTYRKINMEQQKSKYNTITLTTLIISIISIIPTINCLSGDINPYKYLIFTLIILGIEIFFLIKDNHKKREWPIYISWLFNTFALISIIVNILI